MPRVPAWRYGAALRSEHGRWSTGIEARHTERQSRVASGETSTLGYTLLNADVAYTIAQTRAQYEIFVRGTNLTDAEARAHTSFLKDFSPLAGRGILGAVRMTF